MGKGNKSEIGFFEKYLTISYRLDRSTARHPNIPDLLYRVLGK